MAKTKTASENSKLSLSSELVLGALIAELIGTFILTFAVLNTQGNPIIASITLLVLVLMLSKLSGGHINPAVTIGLWATRQIGWVKAVSYLVAQFLGAMLAVVLASRFLDPAAVDPMTGESAKLFAIQAQDSLKPFFTELVGAIVFGFGVASVWIGKKEGFEAAFTIGGALLLGLVVGLGSTTGALNPAVALGLGAFDVTKHWMGVVAYGLGPILGVVAGAWLYKLLQSDVALGLKK